MLICIKCTHTVKSYVWGCFNSILDGHWIFLIKKMFYSERRGAKFKRIFRDLWATQAPYSLTPIDRYSLKKLMIKIPVCNDFMLARYVGWHEFVLLHWILYCNFWCPSIRNSKYAKICQFCQTCSVSAEVLLKWV